MLFLNSFQFEDTNSGTFMRVKSAGHILQALNNFSFLACTKIHAWAMRTRYYIKVTEIGFFNKQNMPVVCSRV